MSLRIIEKAYLYWYDIVYSFVRGDNILYNYCVSTKRDLIQYIYTYIPSLMQN